MMDSSFPGGNKLWLCVMIALTETNDMGNSVYKDLVFVPQNINNYSCLYVSGMQGFKNTHRKISSMKFQCRLTAINQKNLIDIVDELR